MITIEITIKISSEVTIITVAEIMLAVADQNREVATMVDISKINKNIKIVVAADNQITIVVDDVEKLKRKKANKK